MSLPLILALAIAGQVADPPNRWTLTDSYYGDVTMVYDGVNAWRGVSSVSLPSNPCCGGGVNFALRYTLTRDTSSEWWLVTQYRSDNFTTHCPVASTAADPPNHAYWAKVDMSLPIKGVSFASNGTVPSTQCWPAFTGVTLRLNLP